MASDSEASCISDPNFAIICGFLEKFGELCAVKHPDFLDLQEMLENTQEVSPHLIDLHIKLLRRGKRSVSSDKWEKALIKFCHCYCSQDAWELERFGYKKARLSSKLNILKNLCEMQFDSNAKFKAEVNRLTSGELRSQPIGRDKFGHSYWYQIDEHCQLRVYREDPDEETWTLVARDREGLVRLIQQLTSGDVGEMVLNEDSNSFEIEKPIIDTGQTSLSAENFEIEGEESCNANDETKINATVEKKSDSQTDLKSDIKIQKSDPSSLKITISTKGTSYVKEDLSIEKKEKQHETPTETTFVQFTQQSKSVDFSNKKKKSINELAANLRNKTTDLLGRNSDADQEMNLSVTAPRIRVKQFSSLSEPPILPICAIENEFQMTETEEDAEEDDEFFQSDLLELPIQLKQTRLLRPTLLSNTKKKTYSDEEQEYGEEIEEPLMLIQGEGNGKDCNNENFFKNEETEYGEIIEETVMYVYGEGSGYDCTTGNTGKDDKNTSDANKSGDTQDSSCLKSSQKEDLNSEAHHSSDLHCKSLKLKSVRIEEKCTSKDVGDKEESKVISEQPTAQSTESKFPKLGKIIFDIKSVDRSTLPVKKLSRWDVGKPSKDLNEKNTDSSKPGDITKSSINETKLVQFDRTSKKFDTTEASVSIVNISDIDKACVSERTLDSKSASSAGIKPTFFFGPRSACIQFTSAVTPNTTQMTRKPDLSETTSQTQQTTSSSDKSSEIEKVSSNYENVPTNVTKADILLKNDPSVFRKDEKNLSVFKKPDSAVSDYSSVLKSEVNSESKHLLISDSDSKSKKRENVHLSENISKNVLIISSPKKELCDEKQSTGVGEITKHKKNVAGENMELSKVNVVSEKDTNDTKSADISTSNKSCSRIKASDMIKKSSLSSGLLTDLKEVSDYLQETSKNDRTETTKETKANKPDKKSETLLETLESLSTLLETESDGLSAKKQEKTTVKGKVQKDNVAEKSLLNLKKQSKSETLDTNKERSKVPTQASEISSNATESKYLIYEVNTKQAALELSAPASKSSVKNDIPLVNTELKLKSCGKESSVQLNAYETDADKITKSIKLPVIKNLAEQKTKDNKSKNETLQIESNKNITDASTKPEDTLPLCSIDSKEFKCSKKLSTSTITAEKQENLSATEKPKEKTKWCYNAQPSRTEEVLQVTESLCSTNVPNINLKIASTKENKAAKNELIVLKKSDMPPDETDILDELSVKKSDNETKNEKSSKGNILSTELKEGILKKQETSVKDQIKSDGAKMETKIVSEGSVESIQNLKIGNTKYEQAKHLLKETCDAKELSSEKGILDVAGVAQENLIKDKPVTEKEHKKVFSSESFKIENLVAKEKTNEKLTEYIKISQNKSSTEKCRNPTDDISHKEKLNKTSTPSVEQIKTLKETSISVEKSKETLIPLLPVTKQKENFDNASVSISKRVENPALTSTSGVTHKEVATLVAKKDDFAKTAPFVSTLEENLDKTTGFLPKLQENPKNTAIMTKKNKTFDKIPATVSKLVEDLDKTSIVKQEKNLKKTSLLIKNPEENVSVAKQDENSVKASLLISQLEQNLPQTSSVSKLEEILDTSSKIVVEQKEILKNTIVEKCPDKTTTSKLVENIDTTSTLVVKQDQNISLVVMQLQNSATLEFVTEKDKILHKTSSSTCKSAENYDKSTDLIVKLTENPKTIASNNENLNKTLTSVLKLEESPDKKSKLAGKQEENIIILESGVNRDQNLEKISVSKLEESRNKKSVSKLNENLTDLAAVSKNDENLNTTSILKLEEKIDKNLTPVLNHEKNIKSLETDSKFIENLDKTTTSILKLEENLDQKLKPIEEKHAEILVSVAKSDKTIDKTTIVSKLEKNPDKTPTSLSKLGGDKSFKQPKRWEESLKTSKPVAKQEDTFTKTATISKLEKNLEISESTKTQGENLKASVTVGYENENCELTSKLFVKHKENFEIASDSKLAEKFQKTSQPVVKQEIIIKTSVSKKDENSDKTSVLISKLVENVSQASTSKVEGSLDKTVKDVIKQKEVGDQKISADTKETKPVSKSTLTEKTTTPDSVSKLEKNQQQISIFTPKPEVIIGATLETVKQKEVKDEKIKTVSAHIKEMKPESKSTFTEKYITPDPSLKQENLTETSTSTSKLDKILDTISKTKEIKEEKNKNILADTKETKPESITILTRKDTTSYSSSKQENLPQTLTSTSKLKNIIDTTFKPVVKQKEVKKEQIQKIATDTKETKSDAKYRITIKGTTSDSILKQEKNLQQTSTSKTVVKQKAVKEHKIPQIVDDPKETKSDSNSTITVSDSILHQEENLPQTSTSTLKLDVILDTISKTLVQQKEVQEENIASDTKETKADSKSAIIRKDTTSDSISKQEKNLPKTSISIAKLEVILDTTSKTVVKQKEGRLKNIFADTKERKSESKSILTRKDTTSDSSSKQGHLPQTPTSTLKLENILDFSKTVVKQKEVTEHKIPQIVSDPKETKSDSKSTITLSDSILHQEENLPQTSTSTLKLDVILDTISKTLVQQKEVQEENIASDTKETKADSKSAIIRKYTTSDSISKQENNLPKTSISTSKLEVILDTTSKTVVTQEDVKEGRIKNIFADTKETKSESKSILTKKDTTSDSSSKQGNLPQTPTSTLKLENILDFSKTVVKQKEVTEHKIPQIVADPKETKSDSKSTISVSDYILHQEENMPQTSTSPLKLDVILDTISKTLIQQKEVEEEKIQKIAGVTKETNSDSKTILTGKDATSHSILKLEENLPQTSTSTPKLDIILDKTLKTVVKQKEMKEGKNVADTKETKSDTNSSITRKDTTSDSISKQENPLPETTTSTSKLEKMLDTTLKTVVKQKEVEKEKIQSISADTKQIKPDSKITLTRKEVTSDFILKLEKNLSQTSTSTSKLDKVLDTISKTKEVKEEKTKNLSADTKETKPELKAILTRNDTTSCSSSKQGNLPHILASTSKLDLKTCVEQKGIKEDKIKKIAADIKETEPDSKPTLTEKDTTSDSIPKQKENLHTISKPIEKQKENLAEKTLQKTSTLEQDEIVGKTSTLVVEQQENISSASSSQRKNVNKISTSVLKLEDKNLKSVEKEEKTLKTLPTIVKPEENIDKTSTLVSKEEGLKSDQKLGKNLKTFFAKQEDNLSKITEMVSKLDKTSKSVERLNEHRQTSVSVEKEAENVGKSSLSSHKPQDPEMKTTQKKSLDKSATGISKIIIERENTNKIDASEKTKVNENILTVAAKVEEPSLEIAKAELQIQTLVTARLVDKHVSQEKEKSEQVKRDTDLGSKKDIIETSKDKLESKETLEKGDAKLVTESNTQQKLDAGKLQVTDPKIILAKSLDLEVNTKKLESNPNISEIDKTPQQSAKIIASKISHQNLGVSSTEEPTKEEEEIKHAVSKTSESNKKELKDSLNKTIQESTFSLDISVNKKTSDKTSEKIDNIGKPKPLPEKSSIKKLEEPISLCQEKSMKEDVTNIDLRDNRSEKSKISLSPKTDPTSSHTEKDSLIKDPATVQIDEQKIGKTDTKNVVIISKKPLSTNKTPDASVKSNEETELLEKEGKKTILEKCTVETEETIAEKDKTKDTSHEKLVNKIIVKDLSKLIGDVEDFSAKEAVILHSETKIDSIDKQKLSRLNEETDLNIVEKKYKKMGTRSETSKRKIIVYDVEKEKDKLVKSISKQEESSITKTISKKAGITKKPEPSKSDINASKIIGEATSISKIVNVDKNELTENISSQITISKVVKTPIKAQSTSDLIIGEVQIKKVPAVDFIKVSKQMTKTLPTNEITIKPVEKSPPSKMASSCDLMIGEVKIKKVIPSTSEKTITSAVKVSGNLIGEVKIKKVVTETQRESRSSSFKKKDEIENTADFDDSSDDMLDSTDFGGDSYMGQSDKSDNEDNDEVIIIPNMSKKIESAEKPKRGRPKKIIALESELPKLKIKSVADLNKSSGLKNVEQDQKQASKVICIDISKLKDVPTKPTAKKISELKQSSSSLSHSVISIGVDDDESNDVLDVPETDPLACSEDEITQTNKQKEATQPVAKALSLATFKMDDTEPDTSLLPEPLARALRNRKIIAAAPSTKIRKRVKSTEVKVEPKVEVKPVINKNVRLTRRSLQMEREFEASSSDDESTEKSVSTSKVMKTTPKRGGARGRRGRGRGGWLTQTSRVSNDSPAVSVSSDAPSEASKADITPEKKSTKKIRRVLGLDIDPSTIIVPIEKDDSETIPTTRSSVRQSRRIAQIKIKEQAERRDIEEITQMIETNEFEKKKKKKNSRDKENKMDKKKLKKHKVTSEEEEEDESETEVTDPKKKHKKKRKHQDMKKLFNVANPWQSSSESDEEEEHEEEEYEEEQSEVEAEQVLKSDHEFSPESDLETAEIQPLRRARTVKKESDTEDPTDEHACQKCGKSDHPEWILLCDKCDCGWHCSCLRPALLVIPEGDWFCPPCQHIALIGALQVQLEDFDKKINRMDLEERRKERLAYVGISLANVLPTKDEDEKEQQSASSSESESSSGSSSADDSEPIYQLRERRQSHSYRFNDYDELINSAIQDELEAVKGAGNQGRGKDIATIVNAEKEEAKAQALFERKDELLPVVPTSEETSQLQKTASDEDSEDELRVVPKHAGRKKHRKLNALDVSSEEDDNNDEDFKGTSEEEEEDIDDVASDESDSDMGRRGKRGGPIRRSTRTRTQRYDKEFINDDTDDEQARKKRKSMWDESESEESDKDWGQKKRSKKQRQFPTSRFSKKSKKKRKHDYDSDPDAPRKPKVKRPRIQFGGLNDSDEDETLGRRTRGKKMNYLDVLDTDSEEEKRPTRKIIDSEDEYVANEEEDDEHEEAVDDVEEEKDTESESDIQTPRVMPRTVLMLPPKGRGKAGIPRHAKPSEPPIPPIIIQKADILPEQEGSIEEELLPVDKMKEIPIIAANPDNLDEEEVETMMMESEEYANKQLELMAIQLAKEKKKKEMELEMAEDMKDDEQMPSTDVQTSLTNVQLPSINVQLSSTNVQLPSDIMQMSPSSIQMSPSNVQMSPIAIQMPPTNIQMPPSNIQFPLSNLQMPPSNVQIPMSPSNMQLSPSSAQFPPRNIQFPPSNVQMPPSNIQMPLTNMQMPPSSIQMPPSSVQMPPSNVQFSSLNIQLPPTHTQFSPTSAQLPSPSNVQLPQTNVPPLQKAQKKRGRKRKVDIEAAAALAAAAAGLEGDMQTVPPITISKAKMNKNLTPQLQSDELKGELSEEGNVPTVVSELQTALPPKRRGRGKGKKALEKEKAAAAAAALAAGLPVPDASLSDPSKPIQMSGTIVPPTTANPMVPKQTDLPIDPNLPGKLGIAAPPQPFSQSQPTPSVITRMLQSQPMPAAQNFTQAANNMAQKYFSNMHDQPPRGVQPGQFSPMAARGGRGPSPYRQSPPTMNIFSGLRPGPASSPHRLRSPGPPMQPMFHNTHHAMDPSPSGGGPISITAVNRDRNSPVMPPTANSPLAQKDGLPPQLPPPYNRGGLTINRFPLNENSPGPSLPSHAMQDRQIRQHLFVQSTAAHIQQSSPPRQPPPGGNFSPYHPPPPNYHYGTYPPAPALAAADDALPPTDYQGSPYPEHYTADGPVNSSEGSNSKPFDEEGSGEFGGLVSYFSSQREDDLDT